MRPRVLIAEDEAPQRAELAALLGELWPQLEIAAECDNGPSALKALREQRFDLAFLDIQMPGANGLEVARSVRNATHVVFVTAYDQFAVRAFEAGAADYLLKPVIRERLAATVVRLKARIALGEQADLTGLLAALRSAPAPEPHIRWITATVRDGVRMVPIEEVLFFQSEDKLTRVVVDDGDVHIRTPLKSLLRRLDPNVFWQVHRSAIVRASAIRAVRRNEEGQLRLVLAGRAETLPVSPDFARRFKGM